MIMLPSIGDPVIKSAAGTSYTLTRGIIGFDIEDDSELVRSVINGHQTIIQGSGEFINGTIDVYALSLADMAAIQSLKYTSVRLWPFGRGAIPATTPTKYYPYVDVVLTKVYPYHAKSRMYLDAIILTFASVDPYTLSWAADSGMGSPV